MNIWAWVGSKEEELRERGEHRLADIVDKVPDYAINDHHDKVDLIIPEGIALARAKGEKWVELFLRHWNLQSQVLKRNNAKGMLQEAVDLLDFSHQEDTRGCPQRICVVQDLASCYATKDGPGFIEERLQVSIETLKGIDGSWPCYECVSAEYNSALLDDKRYDDVLNACDSQTEELRKHDKASGTQIALTKSRALLELSRYDEALNLITNVLNDGSGEGFERNRALLISLIHATKGEYEKSINSCLPFTEVVISHQYYENWVAIQSLLVENNCVEIDSELLCRFHLLASNLEQNGAIRTAITVLCQFAKIAIISESFFSARTAIEKIEALIPELNKDLGASQLLAELFTQLEKRKDVWDIEIPEKQVESFLERKFDSDEEMALAYEKAIVHWPESSEIIITLSRIYEDNFMECKGKNLLEKSVKEFPSNAEIQYHYGRFLVTNFGKDSFKSIFDKINTDELTDDAKGNIYWLYSFAFDNSEKNISYDYLKKYLKINPDSINGNVNAAQIACDLERYEESIGFWNKLIELDPEDTRYHWDRLVPSTLAEDWPLVRLSAQALGIELETKDGPVYQEMEFIRLKFIDEMGDSDILLAKRTGLVTARVTSIKSLGEEQRYKHDVVFDATPSNALDQEDEDGYACDSEGYYTLLFSVVKTVREPKTLIIEVDGINPGKEKIANLEEIVSHLGYELDQRSSDEYIITMDDEVEHPGWYAYMMIPEDSSNAELQVLNEKMKEYSSLLEHPLVWPILLEKLGDEELLQQQSEIQEKYNL